MNQTNMEPNKDLKRFDERPEERPDSDKGRRHFPISDMQFDVVTLVFEKSKALQAYDKYLRDCQSNPELFKVFEEIAQDDRKHIEKLKGFLGKA